MRSKIVQNIDASLIPNIARRVDKTSFKGRMIFCKPYVPKTPPKSEHPASRKDDADKPATDVALVKPKQVIPGLPENERKKGLKSNEKKIKKKKKVAREEKETTDPNNLSQKDFMKVAKKIGDITEKFQFSDDDDSDDSDDFEDSKDELEDVTAFTTPINFKSASGKNVALSESKPRSRSTSIKRKKDSDPADNDGKMSKSMKSGLPATKQRTTSSN